MTLPEDLIPWCCRHKALLAYIAVCCTLLVISAVCEMLGVW